MIKKEAPHFTPVVIKKRSLVWRVIVEKFHCATSDAARRKVLYIVINE